MKKIRLTRILPFMMAAAVPAFLMSSVGIANAAEQEVSYEKRVWDADQNKVVSTTETISDYTVLDDVSGNYYTDKEWIVVNKDTSISGYFCAAGTVNLLICNGATLTTNGIVADVNSSGFHNTINIYGQSGDSGKIVTKGAEYAAGIGAWEDKVAGNINIYGGTIEATGGKEAAGIGSGDEADGGKVSIYGGKVTARGGRLAAGIGGGDDGVGGTINIYGGEVTATGGYRGSGIGGGEDQDGGNIHIYGGTVKAYGGSEDGHHHHQRRRCNC